MSMGRHISNLSELRARILSAHTVALFGFVVCLIAALLPWLQVRAVFSSSGLEQGSGVVVLAVSVLGVLAAAYGIVSGRQKLGWLYAGAGVLLFALGLSVLFTAEARLLDMGYGREENLLSNPGFEQGDAHWGNQGKLQLHEQEAPPREDSTSWWRIARDGRNRTDSQLDAEGERRWFTVAPGETYEMGGDLISDGNATARFYGELRDEEDNRVTWITSSSLRTTSTVWTPMQYRYTIPADGRALRVFIQAVDQDGWAGFDNLYLRPIYDSSPGAGLYVLLLGGLVSGFSVLGLPRVRAVAARLFPPREGEVPLWEAAIGLMFGIGLCGAIIAVAIALWG